MQTHNLSTTCCIAGGGPAGMMLGILLARAGVDTIVLEKHEDFFRDFRGDTIHPSTLDLIDQLGLREKFDAIAQSAIHSLDIVINGNRLTPVDFSHLSGANKSIALMPQWDFLSLLAEEGAKYSTFRLMMATEAIDLMFDGGRVSGVRARTPVGLLSITAALTVAADGRASTLRHAAGLVPKDYGVAIDVLWFRLPKTKNNPPDTLAYLDAESMIITIPRTDYFQSGMLIRKGDFKGIQEAGLDEFRARIVRTAPFLAEVVSSLEHWDQIKLLTVQVNRLEQWGREGFLCIGDAAHAMSPAFGVGINYAVQDAVASANLLVGSLRAGSVTVAELQRVQKRRLKPVACMQPLQLMVHRFIGKPGGGAFLRSPMSWWQRAVAAVALPVARRVTGRIVGRGFRPERIEPQLDPRPSARMDR
ncbi:FAD-dependent oxidoreductase [Arthrobacter sp.]|uniref:FAD-dependent oxidoreductase n=1 Tax=Arthrobacter sp. TaxID=1667 RepID=UPI0026E0E451|nr:FAD-dependent oxidoreductase [Arthrobacter sp.]MDO5752001.1 FAD-dependent oxidoreductase [Arthrobacter sp.]